MEEGLAFEPLAQCVRVGSDKALALSKQPVLDMMGGWALLLGQGWEAKCCFSSSVIKVGSSSWS